MSTEDKYKAALRSARDTIHSLKESNDSLKRQLASPDAPIAIIGMAGEFPGAGSNVEAFRNMLLDGVDAAQEIPSTRWNHKQYFNAEPGTSGKYYCTRASFITRDPFAFDHRFFGLHSAETEMMDPQQRILLTQSHHALEDAGIRPSSLRGTDTGVFIGISSFDHIISAATPDLETRSDPYTLTGSSFNSAPGRLSYFYDIHGPCKAFDTACSSSLIATLSAVEALRKGECPIAIAGGVNLMLSPLSFVALSSIHALSVDGLCRAFGEEATGFGRGEGCGIIVLKRLADAQAANDRIHAVILGGATGHDGQSSGFTAPSGLAQQRVITRAMRDAGVTPGEIGYVETHGTGTDLGDPIEAAALTDTFVGHSPKLLIGSVKSNVGHLEAAAGMPALMKAVFAVRDGEIAPSLHAEKVSPKIDWKDLPIEVCRKRTAWNKSYPRRLAGVSSFGISGTLAHLILAAPPDHTAIADESEAADHPDWQVLPISARSRGSLTKLSSSYKACVEQSATSYEDICATAVSTRDDFEHRIAVCAPDSAEATACLSSYLKEERCREVLAGTAGKRPKIAFLFSGQGSQTAEMGQALYNTSKVFRDTIDTCNSIASQQLEASLREVMFDSDTTRLDRTRFTQPAIFAMGAALTNMWRSFDIRPTVVLGHSIGEYAAAYAAGVITLEQGMAIVLERARLADSITTPGRMAAVLTDAETARKYIEGTEADIAADNGTSVAISGPSDAVAEVCRRIAKDDIAFREMPVSQAFHSKLIEPVLKDFERFQKTQQFGAPSVRFVSAMSAEDLTNQTDWKSYWAEQMRKTVQFHKALGVIEQADIYLEIGASPTLTSLCRTKDNSRKWLFSQAPGVPAWKQVSLTLARLYTEGSTISWPGRTGAHANANLPSYPFNETSLRPPQPEGPKITASIPVARPGAAASPYAAVVDMQMNALARLADRQRQALGRIRKREDGQHE